jgi:protein-tyrosine phosphatase
MTSNQSSNIFFILDGRSNDKFDKEHIVGSELANFPVILEKRISRNPEKFLDFVRNEVVTKILTEKLGTVYYLIDSNFSESLKTSLKTYYGDSMIFEFYDNYKELHDDIQFEQTKYQLLYPITQSPPHTPDMRFEISEIILGLYLSGEEVAMNKELLNEKNVTTILNVTSHIPFYHESEFTYHRIPIIDAPSIDIKQYFDETFKIIDDVIKNNKSILVHCHAGISRSATIVIAYIMKKNNIKMNEAYKIVHQGRPCISPNLGFCGQLMLYEKELKLN